MKLFALLTLLFASAFVVAKEDLEADASLRIGVKYRPEECTVKSKNGDKLSMHYTVSDRSPQLCVIIRCYASWLRRRCGRARWHFTSPTSCVVKML